MKKYIKHLMLVAFLFVNYSYGQENFNYRPNNNRTLQQQVIEKEIEEFIVENLDKYELTPQRLEQIKQDVAREEKEHGHSHAHLLPQILLETKKNELRELYFSQNDDKDSMQGIVDSMTKRLAVRYICDNGGFEDGFSDDYFFEHNTPNNIDFSCEMAAGVFDFNTGYPISFNAEAVNSETNPVSLVTADTNEFDATLLAANNTVMIQRVHSGDYSIRLNNKTGGYGVTTMSKVFTVNSSFVSYSFSLIVENPIGHDSIDQPHFIARLYNSNNEIISQNCIIANVLNTQLFNNARSSGTPLLYTDWQCAILHTDGIPIGEEARLEFTITDCGQSAHFGTVYIDDICTSEECSTVFGQVHLDVNPTIPNCPTFPVNVCGTFTIPQSINDPNIVGTLNNITMTILQDGEPVTSNIGNPEINGNTFCFELDQSDFIIEPASSPSGNYEFSATATFMLGTSTVIVTDSSANVGADAVFDGCVDTPPCIDYLLVSDPVVAPNEEEREANIQVVAENVVNNGATVYYHGGREVVLIEGFDGLLGSVGHYYVTGCDDGGGLARPAASAWFNPLQYENTIDLIEKIQIGEGLTIYPNPAVSELNIIAGTGKVKSLSIYSIDGKVIMSQEINSANYKLDISTLAAGIYLLSVEINDGEVTSHKIIKE